MNAGVNAISKSSGIMQGSGFHGTPSVRAPLAQEMSLPGWIARSPVSAQRDD
jgi:hypothetical protein